MYSGHVQYFSYRQTVVKIIASNKRVSLRERYKTIHVISIIIIIMSSLLIYYRFICTQCARISVSIQYECVFVHLR